MQGRGKGKHATSPRARCAASGKRLVWAGSGGKPSPKVSLPWQSLAITLGINRRPGAGGGIDCAEGDSGPPGNGCELRWARPCEASGALFLSNGGSGGGHVPCTLWPPPAPFGYFPVMESTSSARRRTKPPTRSRFLMEDKGRAFLAFPVSQRVSPLRRRPKGFRSPFGNLRPFAAHGRFPQETDSLWQAGKEPSLLSTHHRGFRLSGGDQRAFRSPFGNLRPFAAHGGCHKKQIPCGRQEKSLPCFPRITEGFASAEATRGAFRSFRNPQSARRSAACFG